MGLDQYGYAIKEGEKLKQSKHCLMDTMLSMIAGGKYVVG